MRSSDPWWQPRPMTEEEMKMEIAMSPILHPKQEFSEADISKTLQALNLNGDKYVARTE